MPERRSGWRRWLPATALLLLAAAGLYHSVKPMPDGLNQATPLRPAHNLKLLADYTYTTPDGQRRTQHQLFDEILRLIHQAERLIVVDMFLFNDFAGASSGDMRPLSAELTAALMARKQERPALRIIVITDPFNTLYGGVDAPHLQALQAAGIALHLTRLEALRDSNPLWSSLWRVCCQWWGNSGGLAWLPNPLGPGEVNLRSYLALLNFKANHRKTLVVDDGENWTAVVSSANPHDASSAHSNLGLRFSGEAALDLSQTELAVPVSAGSIDIPLPDVDQRPPPGTDADADAQIQILTESRIRKALLAAMTSAAKDDRIDIGVFYFSHQPLAQALIDAHHRGVNIRLLLDPNEHAFGRTKSGVPNRPLAATLHVEGIPIRWCNTHGEQCHSKFLLKTTPDGNAELILGSANFTRRNLNNLNLETDVRLLAPANHETMQQAQQFFDQQWQNTAARQFSVDYSHYADDSLWRYWQYRLMEATGLSTF